MCCNYEGCHKGLGCKLSQVARVLMYVGGVNWGLVGLGMLFGSYMNWNLVSMVFGSMPTIEGIVYTLVGVSTVYVVIGCKCSTCQNCVCKDPSVK